MKKQWFWLGLGAFGLAAVPLWLFQGCASNPPPLSSIVPTPLPVNMVSNFHDGSLFVNPALSNGTGGYFTAETYGGAIGLNNEIDGSVNPNVLLIRPDTGQYAIHLYGMEYDTPANTANPAMELFCFLKNNPADMAPRERGRR